MQKSKFFSLLAIVSGLVLLGAGCAKTTRTDTPVTPAPEQPSPQSLPISEPIAPATTPPASQPAATVPPKTTSPTPTQPANNLPSAPASAPALAPAKKVSVAISGFSFQPNSITISVGDTITWTNNDSAPHTVTADGGSFGSGAMPLGGTFSHTFTTPGTFSYNCSFHGSMHGAVIVE